MKFFISAMIAFLLSSSVFGASRSNQFSCENLSFAKARLQISSYNWSNRITTRTSAGGPFVPQKMGKCSNDRCDILNSNISPILKYEPSHPDANTNGYVSYPNIDGKAEKARASLAAHIIKGYASNGKCGVQTMFKSSGKFTMVNYPEDTKVLSDRFVFDANGEISIWERMYRLGERQIIKF